MASPVGKMIAVRVALVVIALIAAIGFVPVDEQRGYQTPVSRLFGFLRPKTPETASREASDVARLSVSAENKTQNGPVYDFSDKTEGDEDAPLQVYVFSSLTCTHCAVLYTRTLPVWREKYVKTGKIRLIHKDFPLESRAMAASLVARCTDKEHYEGFVTSLFENQSKWMMRHDFQEALAPYALNAGLSKEQMKKCATNKAAFQKLQEMRIENMKTYGLHGTPLIIIKSEKRMETMSGLPDEKAFDKKVREMSDEVGVPEKSPAKKIPAGMAP